MTKYVKHSKEQDIFYYHTVKGEKLWMFRHTFYDSLGKRREKKKSGFKTDKAAIKALLEVKAQTISGQTKQIETENMTVSQWLDIWLNMNIKKWKIETVKVREGAIENHLKPLIGNYKLQKIDRALYQREFIDKLTEKYKASTIRLWHTVFKIAINAAVEEEILTRNKLTKVVLPEEGQAIDNFLTEDELKILLDDLKQNENMTNYTFFLLLAFSGMRKGEALALTWNDIDFTDRTITINKTRSQNGIGTAKTKNSYRTILIDEMVIKQLQAYRKYCIEVNFRFQKKLQNENMVFIDDEICEPICVSTSNYILRRSIKRAGVNEITVHGLRHTHATILLNSSMNLDLKVKVIAERLGNTVDMIYEVYGHTFKEIEQEVADLFSKSMGL